MYATPIVYPMSQIPEKWQWVFALNPMSATVETARYAFLGAGVIRPWNLGISLGMTALVLFAGIVMFSRIEKTFMDTV
jgi:lipopolysaccharide transport system permease protein